MVTIQTDPPVDPYREEKRRNRGIFAISVLVFGATLALSVPLRCVPPALMVGGMSLGCGAGLGLSLAGITRTRRVGLIYLFLLIALLLFLPPFLNLPFASPDLLTLTPQTPALLENYFDYLRWIAFLCGIPYPFARFGHHAPDNAPAL